MRKVILLPLACRCTPANTSPFHSSSLRLPSLGILSPPPPLPLSTCTIPRITRGQITRRYTEKAIGKYAKQTHVSRFDGVAAFERTETEPFPMVPCVLHLSLHSSALVTLARCSRRRTGRKRDECLLHGQECEDGQSDVL